MKDIKEKFSRLREEFQTISSSFKSEEKKEELKKLEVEISDPDFWNNQEKARAVMQEIGDLKTEIEDFEKIETGIKTLEEFLNEGLLTKDFERDLASFKKLADKIKLKSFLSGVYDKKNAMVSINAGQGGTEAMDWASMLYRMYLRHCEKKGWSTETLDYSAGEEAGIKSVTFKVGGNYAYGYLKGESGTHRLVRQSPFNANNLRQTSFALVGVLPELDEVDLPGIIIKDEDLEWQFYRASSQGGQNVQKVSTAVRLTHKPTGIVVTAQNERFQEQNRRIALSLLRAKLWIMEEEKKKNTVLQIKGEYKPASWGNQIRSYVLHPYKMVKDLRTQVESSNPEAILDGELDEFIEAELGSVK